MSSPSREIRALFQQREREYLMEQSRVTMKSSVENVEVGDFKIDTVKEGESLELPRWVAEELVKTGMAEITEEPFENEMYKALSREKMLGPFQLSSIPSDFYLKMRRRLALASSAVQEGKMRKEEFEKLRAGSYDLIGIRLGKLLSLSSSSTTVSTIADKLTPEEKAYFTMSQSFSKEWKDSLLRDDA